jgi:tricorn protease interacting factor F2/3
MKVERYNLFLDFEDNNFKGKEIIEVETEGNIELDSLVKINSIYTGDNSPLKYEVINDKVLIYTGNFKGKIFIEFEGKVSTNSLVGIYRSKDIITTQFEPNFANRLFPCVDNPEYKAKFSLKVSVNRGLQVISNMPTEKIEEKNGKLIYHFKETPPMSTYLLFLGIGEFEEIQKDKVIVATTKGKIYKARFALESALKILKYYENYFNMPYELPKLHLIAVPDTSVGAMENWGAITFRESSLLVGETSSLENRKDVLLTIAHEIAHQWFGNLVTLKWWDDLWLNESFATFLELKCNSKLFPALNKLGDFINEYTYASMFEDSLTTTHKIKAEIKTPVEINEAFDQISYGKGASILRMIEAYIGEDNFRNGIVNYLNKYRYSNATAKDFFASLNADILEDWISKPGYPVIFVNVEGNKIILKQKRFALLHNVEDLTYKVPITIEVNNKLINKLLENKEDVIVFDEEVKKLKLNLNRTGFYRVHYNDLNYVAYLNDIEIAGLINDYYNFYIAGIVSLQEFISLINKYKNYKGLNTSEMISSILSYLYKINPLKYKQIAEDYIRAQLIIWKNYSNEEERSLYYRLMRRLSFIDENFSLALSELFPYYDQIEAELKSVAVISYATVTSNVKTLIEKYKYYSFDEDKEIFLNGISAIRDPVSLKEIFMSLDTFKYQHLISLIIWLSNNPYIRKEYYSIFLSHFKEFKDFAINITGGIWGLGMLIRRIFPMLSLINKNEILDLLKEIEDKDLKRSIDYAKEIIQILEKLS